jgi:hypothetical protein
MRISPRGIGALCFGLALTAAVEVHAQDEGPEYVVKEVGDADTEDGVEWRIDAGSTFTLNDNRGVIGQTEGSTWNFGYKLEGNIDIHESDHEWRNSLLIAAGMTKIPNVDLAKARDDGRFESIYLYHIVDWFGPFARFVAETSAFQGADVRAEPTVYEVTFVDGTVGRTSARRRQPLTDGFRPTRLKESVGAFVQPLRKDYARLELRAGLGGREIFANNQLALEDNADTADVVEAKELSDVNQLGFEGVVEFKGEVVEKKVAYKAGAEVLVPFVHNTLPPGDERSAAALANWLFTAGLSFKLVEWASLDYDFSAAREPQLIDSWQIKNNLVVTFSITAGNVKKEEAAEK